MELTKNQIQKINNFLEAIGIEYVDIRLEMIDHIASEIEHKIGDIDSFFKDDGLQTPFLRYMLSKKKSLLKKYNSQVKQLNWYYFKKLCRELLNIILQPKYLFMIAFLILFSIKFSNIYFKELSILYFSLLIISYGFSIYNTKRMPKKFLNVKQIRFYTVVNSLLTILPINFPNFINVFYNGNYSRPTMFMYLISLILTSLVHINFFQKQDKIFNTYKYLIK